MPEPLLRTKLIPPLVRLNLVNRTSLIKRLHSALMHKLTLVSAPAGFGKTTTVATWFTQLDLPAAWITLDDDDNVPGIFLSYIIAAFESLYKKVDELDRQVNFSNESDSRTASLKALLNEVSAFEKPFVLVLDDYHIIQEQSVHRSVLYLIDHLPPNFHLIILTRSDPPFPLSRLRGRGELYELRTADLRFSHKETQRYLTKTARLTLTDEQIKVLTLRTEGWIVGLQMAGISLLGKSKAEANKFIENIEKNQNYVLDYLADEVLSQQPEDVHDFLLQTSILTRLTGDLCDALTGRTGCSELLTQLTKANMFIFQVDQDWYRYHPLFRDLLRNRLQQRGKALLNELHQRACDWYTQQGVVEGAINHALAISDFNRAVPLIEKYAPQIIFRGEFSRVKDWLLALPVDLINTKPQLCIWLAWTLIRADSLEAAEKSILIAENNIQSDSNVKIDDDEEQRLLVALVKSHAATLRAVISRARDEPPQIQLELTRKALEITPEENIALHSMLALRLGLCYLDKGDEVEAENQFKQSVRLGVMSGNYFALTTAYYCLVMIAIRAGSPHEAAALCKESIQIAINSSSFGKPLPVNGLPYVMFGTILLEWNDLDNAENYLREGLALLDALGMYQDAEIKLKASYALARIQLSRGDVKSLPDLREIGKHGKPFLRTLAAGLQTSLEVRSAEFNPNRDMLMRKATLWAEAHLSEQKEDLYWDWEIIKDFAYLRYKISYFRFYGLEYSNGEMRELLAMIHGIIEITEQRRWRSMTLEAHILRAMILQQYGMIETAIETIEEALNIAAPHGYIRLFLDEGEPMAKLLYGAVENGVQSQYAGKLLDMMKLDTQNWQFKPTQHIEPLTRREIDVLRLLGEGLSNKEIGKQLSISLGTVKRHTANINGKLGVKNRTEAVVHAQKLGIL